MQPDAMWQLCLIRFRKPSTPRSYHMHHAQVGLEEPHVGQVRWSQPRFLHAIMKLKACLHSVRDRLPLTLHVCQFLVDHQKDVSIAIYHTVSITPCTPVFSQHRTALTANSSVLVDHSLPRPGILVHSLLVPPCIPRLVLRSDPRISARPMHLDRSLRRIR